MLLSRLPRGFNSYYEPFVGGGALFFALNGKARQATIVDTNKELVVTYEVVRDNPDELVNALEEHNQNHCEEYYYEVRSQHKLRSHIKIAARLIYLNKTCFNGLYRVNRKGEFNVPMGRYVNPAIVNEATIRACHHALQETNIVLGDFADISPAAGDFVYFDPPYHPLDSASFTSYTENDFGSNDQIRLRDFAVSLSMLGVSIMLSNSDTEFIRELYNGHPFHIETVMAPRVVNSKGSARGEVKEVLITNYKE